MLDHIRIDVRGYEKSKAFYRAALAPLNYELIMELKSGLASVPAATPTFGSEAGDKPLLVFMSLSEATIEQRFVRSTKRH